jgi:hypothetical protein
MEASDEDLYRQAPKAADWAAAGQTVLLSFDDHLTIVRTQSRGLREYPSGTGHDGAVMGWRYAIGEC